ncbi:hypothetical protein B0H19DRAFT_476818 [Mycena capillaripes]|nr:hypothetical protein B0H19DRAFT_476818 [Mycena capillaripes]
MHPHSKRQTLAGIKPLPKLLETPILRRAAVLKQRTVHRWRRHMLLGRKHAFLHTSSLCNYWLSSIAVLLCFLSATWGHTMADTGISPTAIIAAIFFPLDFVGLFIALHAARNTQMKSSIHAPVVPAGAPRDAETKKYRITVLGPFPKPESLGMALSVVDIVKIFVFKKNLQKWPQEVQLKILCMR